MGAALTYARRYALFALVGIAGEDDLDAPDLNAPEPVRPTIERTVSTGRSRLNGGRSQAARKSFAGSTQTEDLKAAHSPLKDQLSAVLRDQLLGQLEGINSAEEAAIWAHRILPAKNRLNAANARQVETAFEAKLKKLQGEAEVGEVPTVGILLCVSASVPISTVRLTADQFDKSRTYRKWPFGAGAATSRS